MNVGSEALGRAVSFLGIFVSNLLYMFQHANVVFLFCLMALRIKNGEICPLRQVRRLVGNCLKLMHASLCNRYKNNSIFPSTVYAVVCASWCERRPLFVFL
jgi:hypothetical protein